MKKNYMVPQTEVMQFSSVMMQDAIINVVNHSGGTNSGDSSSFDNESQVW